MSNPGQARQRGSLEDEEIRRNYGYMRHRHHGKQNHDDDNEDDIHNLGELHRELGEMNAEQLKQLLQVDDDRDAMGSEDAEFQADYAGIDDDLRGMNDDDSVALRMFLGGDDIDSPVGDLANALQRSTPVQQHTEESQGMRRLIGNEREAARASDLAQHAVEGATPAVPGSGLRSEVLEVFVQTGEIMRRVRHGGAPRAILFLANQPNWMELLQLTNPDSWSPYGVLLATRAMVNALPSAGCCRYLQEILMPRVISDVREQHSVSIHIYAAMRHALTKPSSFFKGFIFPLASSPDCTVRTAVIVASVLRRYSIPVEHSSVAIYTISTLPFQPIKQYFLNVLLDKKYSLSPRVLDTAIDSVLRYRDYPRQMPLVWQRTVLILAQRYSQVMTPDQAKAMNQLASKKCNPQIAADIRRQFTQRGSAAELTVGGVALPNDDAMMDD